MMKISIINLLWALLLLGCGKRPWEPGKLALWKAQYSKKTEAKREISQALERPECFKQRYTVPEIQREIANLLEKNNQQGPYNKEELWRGINLQGFPQGHVRYLKDSRKILSSQVDISHCLNAPCVFNTIYGKSPDDIAGHAALWLYLKAGYSLSIVKNIPSFSLPNNLPLKDFYFTDIELYLLWSAIQSMPNSLFGLRTLQYLYRFPHNTVDPEYEYTKALASPRGIYREGYILFFNGGFSRRAIFHEVGHHFDYSLGDPSEKDEFLKLSGWESKTYHEDGQLVKKWELSSNQSGLDGFLSDYSRESPREDFADSVAFYFLDGDRLAEVAPRKFAYVKDKVFGGTEYTDRGITGGKYLYQLQLLFQSQGGEWLTDCLSGSQASENGSANFRFTPELQDELAANGMSGEKLSCLESKVGQELEELKGRLKYERMNACIDFKLYGKEWWTKAAYNSTQILFNKIAKRKKALDITTFRNKTLQDFDAEELAIQCHYSGPPEDCYLQNMRDYVLESAKDYSSFDKETIESEYSYLAKQMPYSKHYQMAKNGVRGMMQISSEQIKDKVDPLLNDCRTGKKVKTKEDPVVYYDGHSKFLLKQSFVDCINTHYEITLQQLLNETGKQYETADAPLKKFTQHTYSNDFLQQVEESVDVLAEKEKLPATALIRDKTVRYFKENPDWHLEGPSGKSVLDICRTVVQKIWDENREAVLSSSVLDIRPGLAPRLCGELSLEGAYKNIFSGTNSGKVFNILWDAFLLEWKKAITLQCPNPAGGFLDRLTITPCIGIKIIPSLNKAWNEVSKNPESKQHKLQKKEFSKLLIVKAKASIGHTSEEIGLK